MLQQITPDDRLHLMQGMQLEDFEGSLGHGYSGHVRKACHRLLNGDASMAMARLRSQHKHLVNQTCWCIPVFD